METCWETTDVYFAGGGIKPGIKLQSSIYMQLPASLLLLSWGVFTTGAQHACCEWSVRLAVIAGYVDAWY